MTKFRAFIASLILAITLWVGGTTTASATGVSTSCSRAVTSFVEPYHAPHGLIEICGTNGNYGWFRMYAYCQTTPNTWGGVLYASATTYVGGTASITCPASRPYIWYDYTTFG